jgi:XTP/dITP diphosphohydrolase
VEVCFVATVELRFISSSAAKIAEVRQILAPFEVAVSPVDLKIEEIQTEDLQALVRHKALTAFDKVRRPLLVEHTAIYLDHLNGFPGGLTALFWDRLREERFCELFGTTADPGLTVKTMVGYVDGRKIAYFEGAVAGRVAPAPAGDRGFGWDCAFIPEGRDVTYAELTAEEKNRISMRRLALEQLAAHLEAEAPR